MTHGDRYKPAVTKDVLLFLAGVIWLCVGGLLLSYAYTWMSAIPRSAGAFGFVGAGIVLALVIHHFGLLKIVDKNIARILPMTDRKCLFSFITWKSYVIISVMVAMGVLLRHSAIPKPYLAVMYIGMGLALVLSSFRYIRVFFTERTKAGME